MNELSEVLFGFFIGGGLVAGLNVWLEWRANRPRRVAMQRDYFDPCGPKCSVRATSQIGSREWINFVEMKQMVQRTGRGVRHSDVRVEEPR